MTLLDFMDKHANGLGAMLVTCLVVGCLTWLAKSGVWK